jgi:hypothetical protein
MEVMGSFFDKVWLVSIGLGGALTTIILIINADRWFYHKLLTFEQDETALTPTVRALEGLCNGMKSTQDVTRETCLIWRRRERLEQR